MTILLKHHEAEHKLELDILNSHYRAVFDDHKGPWIMHYNSLAQIKSLGWTECNIKLENK